MTQESHPYTYIGDELEVFQHAVHWKKYWYEKISAYMGQQVLEVGAGIGGTTRVFADYQCEQWVALEPDSQMVEALHQQQTMGIFPANTEIIQGTVQDLDAELFFDSILYIDVLEHIEQHQEEIFAAAQHLKVGGNLIVLSPAFQFLYTPFDESIGHYRRYHKKDFPLITPANCKILDSRYLDAVGAIASMGNLLLLRSSEPSLQQIKFWDNFMVPISKVVDPLIGYRFGRSVICIWQRQK